MNPNLTNVLLISAIGMGLVFAAILLLWGLMEVLMRFTAARPAAPAALQAAPAAEPAQPVEATRSLKLQAAAAAVAAALAQQQARSHRVARRPVGSMTAWQAAGRASEMNLRKQPFYQRKRGNGQ